MILGFDDGRMDGRTTLVVKLLSRLKKKNEKSDIVVILIIHKICSLKGDKKTDRTSDILVNISIKKRTF